MNSKPKLIIIIIICGFLIWLINLIWYKPFFIDLYFERFFIEYGLRHPEMLTSVRALEKYGITTHNKNLNNISLEYRLKTFEELTKAFEMLRSYKRNKLDKEEQLSHDVLDFYLEKIIFKQQFFQHEIPLNHLKGIQVALPTFLIENQTVNNLQDAEYYLERISKINEKVYQYIQTIMLKDDGDKPPAFVFEYMIDQIDTFLTGEIEENILYKDFEQKISKAKLINPDAKSELLYNLRLEIGDNVYQAYKELKIKLEVEREHASDKVGIWQYLDGETYYYLLLNESLTVDTSMYDLEKGALAEIDRLHTKVAEKFTIDKSGVKIELASFYNQQLFHNDTITNSIDQLQKSLKYFLFENDLGKLNKTIDLKYTKKFNANYELAQYVSPSLDGNRKASLLVSKDLLSFVPEYMYKGFILKEVFPGNHYISESIRLTENLPNIRKIINFNTYSKGWKYYVLEVASDVGLTKNTSEEIGCLQWQLLKASLAVIDLRIHQNMCSREEAIEFVVLETGLPKELIVHFVDKVIVEPANAPAYLVGFNAFKKLQCPSNFNKSEIPTQEFVSNLSKIASYGSVPIKFFPQLIMDDSVINRPFLAGSSVE